MLLLTTVSAHYNNIFLAVIKNLDPVNSLAWKSCRAPQGRLHHHMVCPVPFVSLLREHLCRLWSNDALEVESITFDNRGVGNTDRLSPVRGKTCIPMLLHKFMGELLDCSDSLDQTGERVSMEMDWRNG